MSVFWVGRLGGSTGLLGKCCLTFDVSHCILFSDLDMPSSEMTFPLSDPSEVTPGINTFFLSKTGFGQQRIFRGRLCGTGGDLYLVVAP